MSIQKVAGTETTGALLFRNGMHCQTNCFENYAALHLDNMPWLSQELHFVISIFTFFSLCSESNCSVDLKNRTKRKICF